MSKNMNSTNQSIWINEVATALCGLFDPESQYSSPGSTQLDKLAYLAYTGKIELFIRDELSFALNQNSQGLHNAVRREFRAKQNPTNRNQIDIAKIGANNVIHCLQAKSIYAGDLVCNGTWAPRSHGLHALASLLDDFAIKAPAALKGSPHGTPLQMGGNLGLLLVTDIESIVTPDPLQVLAYTPVVQRALAPALWNNSTRSAAIQQGIAHQLSNLNWGCSVGSLPSGYWSGLAFGQVVNVHWFLLD